MKKTNKQQRLEDMRTCVVLCVVSVVFITLTWMWSFWLLDVRREFSKWAFLLDGACFIYCFGILDRARDAYQKIKDEPD